MFRTRAQTHPRVRLLVAWRSLLLDKHHHHVLTPFFIHALRPGCGRHTRPSWTSRGVNSSPTSRPCSPAGPRSKLPRSSRWATAARAH
eukprot:15683-Eustigmatos_ZCMA.PRE.1